MKKQNSKVRKNKKGPRKVNISASEFKPENVQVRVTMFLSVDIVHRYDRVACAAGVSREALINAVLRNSLV